ncbi:type IV secretion system DNA-binding domain-containing protein [Acidithiobacillus sp.]
MGKDSKTTASFLAQMAASLSQVVNIGVGDADSRGKPWSVRDWLGGHAARTAIVAYLPSAKAISRAYAASVVEQATRRILDMPDCPPSARRIWFFLDEVPQAGKILSITELLEAARSKGVRVVLGMQSVAQVREIYGEHTARIWVGMTGIKVVAALTEPDDQKWAAGLLGDRELDRLVLVPMILL